MGGGERIATRDDYSDTRINEADVISLSRAPAGSGHVPNPSARVRYSSSSFGWGLPQLMKYPSYRSASSSIWEKLSTGLEDASLFVFRLDTFECRSKLKLSIYKYNIAIRRSTLLS
jgi:hypothetical protein